MNSAVREEIPQLSVAIISNVTLDPFLPSALCKEFSQEPVNLKTIAVTMEELVGGNTKEQLQMADIIVIWLHLLSILQDISYDDLLRNDDAISIMAKKICGIFHIVRSKSNASVIWFDFDDTGSKWIDTLGYVIAPFRLANRLNQALLPHLPDRFVTIDTTALVARVGVSQSYSDSSYYRWNAPFGRPLIQMVAQEVHRQYRVENGPTKKCLVLDCDGVLWGGVLCEDGPDNIVLSSFGTGKKYKDFQRFVSYLCSLGIILALCSKNKREDLLYIFDNHSDMILRIDQIASIQANWNDKATNLRKIADELNIGLESITFVDDTPYEVKAVTQKLPQVDAVLFDPLTIYGQLRGFYCDVHVDTESVRLRMETYRTNAQRKALASELIDQREYRKELHSKIDIYPAHQIEYRRLSELTLRTNKCTNGRRYDLAKLYSVVQGDKYCLYCVTLSDCFGDLGIVGAVGIEGERLDLFCLSCRALERGLEEEILSFIRSHHSLSDYYYSSTNRNRDFLLLLEKFIKRRD